VQAVLLEGRAWQARAAAVLAQPSVVAAAAAAIEADPCASVCSLWNADIAAAAAMEMKELEALIGERDGGSFCEQGLRFVCVRFRLF
jgi:thiamine biosynthesis lipoprotein ApbE